jgi:hypothetical protein
MGAIQSSVGGVVNATLGAVKKTSEAIAEAEKKEIEAPKTEPKKPAVQNKVIDKAAEANRIAMMHIEARITQTQAFKERLEAVKTGTWKASRTKIKRRGK